MNTESLLEGIYYEEIPVFGEPPKPKPPLRARALGFGPTRGGSFSFKSLVVGADVAARGVRSVKKEPKEDIPEDHGLEGVELFSLDDELISRSAGEMDEILFEDSDLVSEVCEVSAVSAVPDIVGSLEKILSTTSRSPVEITCIRELPTTRKQVKEIYFSEVNSNWLHRAWVFKSDPVKTAKELAVYYIADMNGVPTGKPIGYEPSTKPYPFDVAILGGAVIEHAGNPYNDLIKNMELTPARIHRTAEAIAKMLADCHIRLTAAKEDFERYGVELEKADPEKEIKERLLAALNIEKADDLIRACKDLYSQQSNIEVISHCDTHTGNLVTKEKGFDTNMYEFGIIDWGSIAFDNPYSDLRDFWLHHQRQASKACKKYDFGFESLDSSYKIQFRISAQRQGLAIEIDNTQKDSLIQSALWNLYEMYDPTRTKDVEEKAKTHCKALYSDLEKLEMLGYRKQSHDIKKELNALLKDKSYLTPILNS